MGADPARPGGRDNRIASLHPLMATLHTARATTSDEAIVEPKATPAADEVFLSPRIVDAVAFEDFAHGLRDLIESAERAAQGLREQVREADAARAGMNQSKTEQIDRLRAGAKILRAITAATDRAVAPRRVEPPPAPHTEQIDRAVAATERRLSLALRTAAREIERRCAEADRRADERTIALDARIDRLTQSERAAREAVAAAMDASARLTEQGRDMAALHERIARIVEELEASASAKNAQRGAGEENGAFLARDLASLIDQAQQIRTAVAESINESSALLDEIQARRKRLAGAVRDAVLACEKAGAIAAHSAIHAEDAARGHAPSGSVSEGG